MGNMLTTTFLNSQNELVWLRNSQIVADRAGVCNLSRSENAECAVELEILVEDSIPKNIQALERSVQAWCEARSETWVSEKCGTATVHSGGSSGILCSTDVASPGVVRWRFRAVHQ